MSREEALDRIKDMSKACIIDRNAYDAITYNIEYGERRYLNRYCSAESNSEFFNMVKRDFPNRY